MGEKSCGRAIMAAPRVFGIASLSANPVPERFNSSLLQSVVVGKRVSVAGRFADGQITASLTSTDGGYLKVNPESELAEEINGASLNGYVEVIGTKGDGMTVQASSIVCLGESMDVNLWNDAVKMSHSPALRHMFEAAAN